MEIVQVCPIFFPYIGGTATHVMEISRRLVSLGINVTVYTTDPSGRLPKREVSNGLEVFRYRALAPGGAYYLPFGLYKALKELKNVSLIHAHDYQAFPAVISALAKSQNRRPFVFTPHFHPIAGSWFRSFLKPIYNRSFGRLVFGEADAAIAVSIYEKAFLEKVFKTKGKVSYIPNGFETETFRQLDRPSRTCDKIVIYVGRLEKHKRVDLLIRAFRRVVKRVPDAQMLVIGDGAYRNGLLRLVGRLKLENHVRFLGFVPRMKLLELYAKASLFVMPSRYEAFSISLVEAMASGLPVIATRVGGMTELIESAKCGFLIDDPPNECALAVPILSILEDAYTSRMMGLQGRNYAFSHFSWDRTARDLLRIYESCKAG
jgi:glycosyltransferase involved in cell wall biosynthesis